mmetsp:Transcript_104194/g.272094  ORF Transcript_104194/g.272094 Transcript_104194/m.272094 type:complete len:218 (+) Transcript_104194:263-916(+)
MDLRRRRGADNPGARAAVLRFDLVPRLGHRGRLAAEEGGGKHREACVLPLQTSPALYGGFRQQSGQQQPPVRQRPWPGRGDAQGAEPCREHRRARPDTAALPAAHGAGQVEAPVRAAGQGTLQKAEHLRERLQHRGARRDSPLPGADQRGRRRWAVGSRYLPRDAARRGEVRLPIHAGGVELPREAPAIDGHHEELRGQVREHGEERRRGVHRLERR